MATRNQPISEALAEDIFNAGVEEVYVRSALTCEATRSVCRHCYGWSLAHSEMVDLGKRWVLSPPNPSVNRVPSSPCVPSTRAGPSRGK
jgi:hypothetical protein